MSALVDTIIIHEEPLDERWQITFCPNDDRPGTQAFLESIDGHIASLTCAEWEGVAADDWGYEIDIPSLVVTRARQIADEMGY